MKDECIVNGERKTVNSERTVKTINARWTHAERTVSESKYLEEERFNQKNIFQTNNFSKIIVTVAVL